MTPPYSHKGLSLFVVLFFSFLIKKKGGQIYKGDDIVCDKEYKTNISFFV